MDEFEREHAAWLHMMDRLLELGIDPNNPNSDYLIGAIRQWGDAYAALPNPNWE